jgi:hypothetical protein
VADVIHGLDIPAPSFSVVLATNRLDLQLIRPHVQTQANARSGSDKDGSEDEDDEITLNDNLGYAVL